MFILDPGPDFFPSLIPDLGIPTLGTGIVRYPGSNNNKRDKEEICCLTFFCSPKFHKILKTDLFKVYQLQLKDKNLSTVPVPYL